MLVSVVIPTYNAGPDLDRCLDSLFAQTLPAGEFEIIVVDDGSTDDTPSRLDRFAEEHPNLRVVHSPHSGWPGRPRNIGMGLASGEFVHFMDQDDRMAPDALRRLAAMGRRNTSDIVLGKVVSDFRGVSLGVYRRNVERCSVHDGPVIDSLTPHKMFRRTFLVEHGIAYPEGQRRLEDQLFMVKAYLATSAISILADYPSYFYLQRTDKANAGARPIDPVGYYGNLREVLDVIRAALPAGPDRARLIRRFVRTEMLRRVSEPWYLRQEPAVQVELFRSVRELLHDVMEPGVTDGFGAAQRLRVLLLEEDRQETLLAFAQRAAGIRAVTRMRSAAWSRGRLKIVFAAELVGAEGRPMELERRGGRTVLGTGLTDGILDEQLDVTDDLAAVRVGMSVRDPATGLEWAVPTKLAMNTTARDGGTVGLSLRVTATIDPQLIALGHPLTPARWQLQTSVSAFGFDRSSRLRDWEAHESHDSHEAATSRLPAHIGDPDRLVLLTTGIDGEVRLDVVGLEVAAGAKRGVYSGGSLGGVWRAIDTAERVARRTYRRLPKPAQRSSASVVRGIRSRVRRMRRRG